MALAIIIHSKAGRIHKWLVRNMAVLVSIRNSKCINHNNARLWHRLSSAMLHRVMANHAVVSASLVVVEAASLMAAVEVLANLMAEAVVVATAVAMEGTDNTYNPEIKTAITCSKLVAVLLFKC